MRGRTGFRFGFQGSRFRVRQLKNENLNPNPGTSGTHGTPEPRAARGVTHVRSITLMVMKKLTDYSHCAG